MTGRRNQRHQPNASRDGRVQVPSCLPRECHCPPIRELQVPEGARPPLSSLDLCTLAAHAVRMPQSLALQEVPVRLHLAGSAAWGQRCLQLSLQLLLFHLQGGGCIHAGEALLPARPAAVRCCLQSLGAEVPAEAAALMVCPPCKALLRYTIRCWWCPAACARTPAGPGAFEDSLMPCQATQVGSVWWATEMREHHQQPTLPGSGHVAWASGVGLAAGGS